MEIDPFGVNKMAATVRVADSGIHHDIKIQHNDDGAGHVRFVVPFHVPRRTSWDAPTPQLRSRLHERGEPTRTVHTQ